MGVGVRVCWCETGLLGIEYIPYGPWCFFFFWSGLLPFPSKAACAVIAGPLNTGQVCIASLLVSLFIYLFLIPSAKDKGEGLEMEVMELQFNIIQFL